MLSGRRMNETVVNCTVVDQNIVRCDEKEYYLYQSPPDELVKPTTGVFWAYLITYLALVLFAGLMSGLTMGLLSLDIMSLEVLKRGGKPHQQRYSRRILQLVKRHHLLLVTLLLANAVAVESMPIFLSKITNEVVAVIVSVTAVLVFGEIVPQAICTRFGLAIGYFFSPLVWFLMIFLFPLSFPIALLLDRILGKDHNTFFRRAELRELVKMHGSKSHDNEEPLNHDEVLIVKSCLEMRDKVVEGIMTPLESVFMMSYDSQIDKKTMNNIVVQGHSRVPVYKGQRDNIVGMLLVKRLIHLDPDDCTPVASLDGANNPPPSCTTTMPLFDLLNQFQTGRSHLYLVYRDGEDGSYEPELVGIITLEDVIEELIGEEIVDETDVFVDVHKRIAVARARLQFTRQSVSAPPIGTHPLNRLRQPWHRSMSEDSQPASSSQREISSPSRVLSIVAEVEEEEKSFQTTPTTNVVMKREESTQSGQEWEGEEDTLPLI